MSTGIGPGSGGQPGEPEVEPSSPVVDVEERLAASREVLEALVEKRPGRLQDAAKQPPTISLLIKHLELLNELFDGVYWHYLNKPPAVRSEFVFFNNWLTSSGTDLERYYSRPTSVLASTEHRLWQLLEQELNELHDAQAAAVDALWVASQALERELVGSVAELDSFRRAQRDCVIAVRNLSRMLGQLAEAIRVI